MDKQSSEQRGLTKQLTKNTTEFIEKERTLQQQASQEIRRMRETNKSILLQLKKDLTSRERSSQIANYWGKYFIKTDKERAKIRNAKKERKTLESNRKLK